MVEEEIMQLIGLIIPGLIILIFMMIALVIIAMVIEQSDEEEGEVEYIDTEENAIQIGDIPNGMQYEPIHPSWKGVR